MDLSGLRTLVRDLNFDTHGVPATVTRPFPDATAIETNAIWLTPTTDGFGGSDLHRQEPRRILCLNRDEVPTVPRGTIVLAPEAFGGATLRWRVEGPDRIDADHTRVIVVPDPEPY